MAIKVEINASAKLPKNVEARVQQILQSVPREHLHGIERLRLVDSITDPRLKTNQKTDLPGLYHPRQGTQKAWLEVAIDVLLPRQQPFLKRLLPRLSFKANLAAVIFSLVGQHYYLTLRHSVKKGQLETLVRSYTEKQLRAWNEREHSFRARLFKPLQPYLEKWGRALQKRAAAEKKKSRAAGA
jgi:hypothetical protein